MVRVIRIREYEMSRVYSEPSLRRIGLELFEYTRLRFALQCH